MWELDELQHYVVEQAGLLAGHRPRACHLADIGQHPDGDLARWRAEKPAIEEWVDENGWNEERGAYVMYPGTEELDASVLLHAISGLRPRRSGCRARSTRSEPSSGAGPLLYRYSGVAEEEGAFVACSFWLRVGARLRRPPRRGDAR